MGKYLPFVIPSTPSSSRIRERERERQYNLTWPRIRVNFYVFTRFREAMRFPSAQYLTPLTPGYIPSLPSSFALSLNETRVLSLYLPFVPFLLPLPFVLHRPLPAPLLFLPSPSVSFASSSHCPPFTSAMLRG